MTGSARPSTFEEARLILRHCNSWTACNNLRAALEDCEIAYLSFVTMPSRPAMQELVGLWTRMLMAMDECGPKLKPPSLEPMRPGNLA